MPAKQSPIRLSPADAAAAWGPEMLAKAQRALRRAEQRLGLTLDCAVQLISFRTEWEFQRYIGERPNHIVAVARPDRGEVAVLRPAWFASGEFGQEQVLAHEMAHLILGRRARGHLPPWLNEGLAMITAGEGDFDRAWRMNVAGALGGLLPLEVLQTRGIFNGPSQDLAYAQSLYVTRFYLKRALPDQKVKDDDPAPLARALADPKTGSILIERLWEPDFTRALDLQWRRSHNTVWSWLMFLSGASFLWSVISVLFLLAYWRKRRMARQVRERFAAEENRDAELGTATPPWEYEGDDQE